VCNASIVGYTNAGKSTLFNALVQASSYAADQLFATLDTTSRRLYLGAGVAAVVSDTVGFIRGLPHTLVAAFRATLEETAQADLLLHVVDASHPNHAEQREDVDKVLAEIGAGEIPQIVVYNKIDAAALEPAVELNECGTIGAVWVSARQRTGLDNVRRALEQLCVVRIDNAAADAATQAIVDQHVA
jgi:GTP-binding protein HflX